jgi:palmitoyltransferase
MTPVHMLLLSFAGCAFTLVMGSFLCYHIYLVLCVFPHTFVCEN